MEFTFIILNLFCYKGAFFFYRLEGKTTKFMQRFLIIEA